MAPTRAGTAFAPSRGMAYETHFWAGPRWGSFMGRDPAWSELHDYDFEIRGPYKPGALLDAYLEWKRFLSEELARGVDWERDADPREAYTVLERWREWRRRQRRRERAARAARRYGRDYEPRGEARYAWRGEARGEYPGGYGSPYDIG